MTSINPVFIYELIKQKVDWDPKLTPVQRISDFIETFNTSNDKTIILNGNNIKNGLPACNLDQINKLTQQDKPISNLDIKNLGDNIKSVVANIKNVCLKANGTSDNLFVQFDLFGFDKKLTDLISDKQSVEALLTDDQLKNATIKKDSKYALVNLGNKTASSSKKDILGLLLTLLQSEYSKVDSKTKDGNLKQQVLNELGLMISDGQKYVELVDVTGAVSDQQLCSQKDTNVNNTMTITNITKYSMLDEGKTFCIDVDIQSYFTQSRIQTINTTNKSNMSSMEPKEQTIQSDNRKEMMDSAKKSVLESYVAGILDQVYKMKDKYKVEILRPNDSTILLKVTDNQTKEIYFNKIDITNAVSDSGACNNEKTDARIREFVTVQKYCKGDNNYKVQFLISGSDHTKITSRKIPFAKLQEAKDQKMFAEYINSLHSVSKRVKVTEGQRVSGPRPKSALVVLNSPYNAYGGVYGGLYGLGLYNSGIYAYPRFGYGGVYSYPYSYGGVYGSPFVYTSPYVSSIVPTAPIVTSPIVSSPVVSAPIYSSVTPLTYNYPIVSTSNYTVGSYYSPYLGYNNVYGYSYASPFQYTYTAPYTYVKSEEKRIKLDKEDVLPTEASSYNELVDLLKDFQKNVEIKKIGSKVIKVCVEKNFIKETHYYEYDDGRIYLSDEHDYELFM